MDYELGKFRPDLLKTVVRGVVVLLGVSSLSVVVFVLVQFGSFLVQKPRTSAEAHAMAHSVPGILVALVFGVGGFGLAGAILLTIAYVNRHRLSAATLVLTGLVGLLLSGSWSNNAVFAGSILLAALGGYALYEDTTDSSLFEFIVSVTTLLWFVELLFLIELILIMTQTRGSPILIVWFVPFIVITWLRRLLGIGALGILATAGWYRYLDRSVPRAPVALAAAILLTFLPDGVWTALSEYAIAGLAPLEWAQVIIATGAALTISAGSLGDVVRYIRRLSV